jgi:hypothetical protein
MLRTGLWLSVAMPIAANCALADETTTEKLDALEKRVQALEAIILHSRNPAAVSVPGQAEQSGNQSLLKLASWSATFKGCGYGSHCYGVAYTLLNGYDKPIKLIDASINFYDLIGERIYGIALTKDVKLAPRKEAIFHGDFSINQFMPAESRLRDLAPADVRAELIVRKLVLEDNSVIDLE